MYLFLFKFFFGGGGTCDKSNLNYLIQWIFNSLSAFQIILRFDIVNDNSLSTVQIALWFDFLVLRGWEHVAWYDCEPQHRVTVHLVKFHCSTWPDLSILDHLLLSSYLFRYCASVAKDFLKTNARTCKTKTKYITKGFLWFFNFSKFFQNFCSLFPKSSSELLQNPDNIFSKFQRIYKNIYLYHLGSLSLDPKG